MVILRIAAVFLALSNAALRAQTVSVSVAAFPGADPSGILDSSGAIQAAIGTGKTVLIPPGRFHVRHMIALQLGQRMVCAGRTVSEFTVGPDFSPTDPAVIQLGTAEPGAEIENCGISFAQSNLQQRRAGFRTLSEGCTVDTGDAAGTGCRYPPAIAAPNAARFRISHVRISGAWDGVSAPGNPGGFFIEDLEVGALDVGLHYDGALDACHVVGLHAWPFGFAGYTPVYGDGQTYAAKIGRCDGQIIENVMVSMARVLVTGAAQITGLDLDGDHADLVIDTAATVGPNVVTVDNWRSSKAYPADSAVQVRSGKAILQGGYMFGGQAAGVPMISVTGGTALISGAIFEPKQIGGAVLQVSGGTLIGRGLSIDPFAFPSPDEGDAGLARFATAFIVQTGGVLDLQGAKFVPVQSAAGASVSIQVDDPGNVVADNDLGGWTLLLPPGAGRGRYGPNTGLAAAR